MNKQIIRMKKTQKKAKKVNEKNDELYRYRPMKNKNY